MTVPDYYDDFVDYELTYLRHPNRRHRRVREHLRPLLERNPESALDVGCGIGLMSVWLSERVPRVIGLDVSPRSIEVCQKLHPAGEFRVCAFPAEPLPDGQFDLIAFIDVLEHLPRSQLNAVFERVGDVIAEDGVVAINLPSRLFAQKENIERQIIDEAVPMGELVAAATAIGMEPLTISRYGVAFANQYVFCAFSRSYDTETPLGSSVGDRVRDRVWYAQQRFGSRFSATANVGPSDQFET